MKKRNIIFFILLLSIIVLISGCGSEEEGIEKCKKKSDCTAKDKEFFEISCEENECSYSPIPNLCGNEKCEGAEKCSDCKDCKGKEACSGKAGEYLTYKCNAKQECQTLVEDANSEEKSNKFEIKVNKKTAAEITANSIYETPFNLDGTALRLDIRLDALEDDIKRVGLKNIEIIKRNGKKGKSGWSGDGDKTLANVKDIKKSLYDTSASIVEDVRLEYSLEKKDDDKTDTKKKDTTTELSEKATVSVKFKFEYETLNSKTNQPEIKEQEFEYDLELVFVDPTYDAIKCDAQKCNDNNLCTDDSCYPGTSICKHVMRSGPCKGNYVCDSGENKCNTPEDCGICGGKASATTEYGCKNNECVIVPVGEVENKRLAGEKSIPSSTKEDIKFRIVKEFNQPFNSKEKFKIIFEVLDMKDTTQNFKITRLELKDGSLLLGEESVSETFSSIGATKTLEIGISHKYTETEVKKTPTLKVTYEYTGVDAKGEPETYTNKDYEDSFGQITILTVE